MNTVYKLSLIGNTRGPGHALTPCARDVSIPACALHAADLAATLVHFCRLPGRTLFRDTDIWGTNP